MRRTIYIVLMALMLFACGKKEVKQVSMESKTSEEAFALAETIRSAFVKNDKPTLQKNSTEQGYREITANKKPYDSLELTFAPRWVEIESTQVLLNITWKGSWTVAGKKKAEERGMAVFVMEGKPLKVSKILRVNPFIVPEQ